MNLYIQESNICLTHKLEIAKSFLDRTIGLIKYKSIADDFALHILSCNSIHTCFMKFAIDCVFVDNELNVVKIVENIMPFRMTLPCLKAESVFEFKAGFVSSHNIKIGDRFYVGT